MKVKGVLLIIVLRPQGKPGELITATQRAEALNKFAKSVLKGDGTGGERRLDTRVEQKDGREGDLTNGGSPGWVEVWARTYVASLWWR